MDRNTKNAALGAAWIMLIFGIGAYYLPTMMLAVGGFSTILAGILAAAFCLAFFMVFWLRGRNQRRNPH